MSEFPLATSWSDPEDDQPTFWVADSASFAQDASVNWPPQHHPSFTVTPQSYFDSNNGPGGDPGLTSPSCILGSLSSSIPAALAPGPKVDEERHPLGALNDLPTASACGDQALGFAIPLNFGVTASYQDDHDFPPETSSAQHIQPIDISALEAFGEMEILQDSGDAAVGTPPNDGGSEEDLANSEQDRSCELQGESNHWFIYGQVYDKLPADILVFLKPGKLHSYVPQVAPGQKESQRKGGGRKKAVQKPQA
ncbi:hypothetical protein OQA88_8134 [Cercophora sp. LCS_1]